MGLLSATLVVFALGARSAIGALGYAHSILGLGSAAGAGLSGGYAVLILVGGRSLARIRVDGSALPIAAHGLAARVFGTIFSTYTRSQEHTRDHQ